MRWCLLSWPGRRQNESVDSLRNWFRVLTFSGGSGRECTQPTIGQVIPWQLCYGARKGCLWLRKHSWITFRIPQGKSLCSNTYWRVVYVLWHAETAVPALPEPTKKLHVELLMVANMGNEDNAWHSEQSTRTAKDYSSLHAYSPRWVSMIWIQKDNSKITSKTGKNCNKKVY